MNKPTEQQIDRLPRWAKIIIHDLNRQREMAVRALNEWKDDQTPSPFSIDDHVCTGEGKDSFKTRYIQAYAVQCKCNGVEAVMSIRDDHIEISWSSEKRGMGEIAMIPESFQKIRLLTKNQMR